MVKRLVDIEDDALEAARAHLHTVTIKDTVNEALRQAAGERRASVKKAFDFLASATPADRNDAWR